MKSFLRLGLAVALLVAAVADAGAATVTSFTLTRLFGPQAATGTKITAVAADSANRVWFATNQYGVTALSNNAVASGFPLYTTLTSVGFTPVLTSVAFLKLGDNENFFLGANGSISGVLYGRMLEIGPSFANDRTLNDELGAAHSTTKVNAMAVDGADRIWLATELGLTSVTQSAGTLTVSANLQAPTGGDTNVTRVVDGDPLESGAYAFYATANRLYMLTSPSSNTGWLFFTDSNLISGIGGIDVDASGNLWVAEAGGLNKERRVLRYAAADMKAWASGGAQPVAVVFTFNPDAAGSAFTDTRTIRTLKVSPATGEVWVGTTGGAFFQKPNVLDQMSPKLCTTGESWSSSLDDVDGLGASCANPGTGWRPVPQADTEGILAVGEAFEAIMLDGLGNAWVGSDKYVRAIITRNLTMNGTRFIGTGARAKVNLIDEQIADPEAMVAVKVGAVEENLLMTPVSPGVYSLTFGFTTSTAATPANPPHNFTVDPATENDIQVSYTYNDLLGAPHTITISATWVEIAPFEDDLLIGGPCFLESVGR